MSLCFLVVFSCAVTRTLLTRFFKCSILCDILEVVLKRMDDFQDVVHRQIVSSQLLSLQHTLKSNLTTKRLDIARISIAPETFPCHYVQQ